MEPDVGVEIMVDAITSKYSVIYSTIIWDDDSTIQAVSKCSYKEIIISKVWLSMAKNIKCFKKPTKDAFHYTFQSQGFERIQFLHKSVGKCTNRQLEEISV